MSAAQHPRQRIHIGVMGGGSAPQQHLALAEQVGRGVAQAGAVLVCGGRGGVMQAAAKGASEAGGLTIGILPGRDRHEANPFIQVAVATGLGEARNALNILNADAVIAVGGEAGTLSEIALALKAGKPVITLDSWHIESPHWNAGRLLQQARSAAEAVHLALAAASAP